jgi:alkylation response protein AidB-like acyl-CoA dehydrogenase
MQAIEKEKKVLKGGEFLISESDYKTMFIPEEFSEDHEMIRQTVRSFVESEIFPHTERIEKLEQGLMPSIMEKWAELGMFGTHMPEELGGSEMDFITNTLIGEEVGPSGSFSVAYNAHTGIGMLPILYFGTQGQKEKYLPGLIDGSLKSSYCLTEPSSGSDALAAKSTAVLNKEGTHYILNGQKMWITNAGFADIFTIFVQVDGDKFTAFIVEKGTPGFSLGAEEKKMGIKGSSTRMVFMEDVKVPVQNLMGEIGKGHLIAFNVLNTGRFKLGASCLGGCKMVSSISIEYANVRHQFKQAISNFGAIQQKLAQQAIRIFATESSIYRTAQLIQNTYQEEREAGESFSTSKLKSAQEYAIECAIIKIIGSETLDLVTDEAVQIHGGMGYSEEGHVARAYRDSRINRIFEGTNEINRLLILSSIFKLAMKGEFDLMTPGMAVQNELVNGVEIPFKYEGPYQDEFKSLSDFKKALIMILGSAAQLAMAGKLDLKSEQEILMNLADIIIDIFDCESTLLRVRKIRENHPEKNIEIYEAILRTFFHDANARILKNGTDAIASFVKTEKQSGFLHGLNKYTQYPLQNIKELRRTVAGHLIHSGKYTL